MNEDGSFNGFCFSLVKLFSLGSMGARVVIQEIAGSQEDKDKEYIEHWIGKYPEMVPAGTAALTDVMKIYIVKQRLTARVPMQTVTERDRLLKCVVKPNENLVSWLERFLIEQGLCNSVEAAEKKRNFLCLSPFIFTPSGELNVCRQLYLRSHGANSEEEVILGWNFS